MVTSELPPLLREIVIRSGLTYRDLGARIGLNPAILSLLVQGKRQPARDTIIALAFECGCNRAELNKLLRSAGFSGLMADGPASLTSSPETRRLASSRSRPGSAVRLEARVPVPRIDRKRGTTVNANSVR
jgi:transcriptional regulator with XRE-family HTH domain